MNDRIAIIGLSFLIILILCAWWQSSENRRLIRRWYKTLDIVSAQQMAHFAWSRTTQLLIMLACCMVVILAYDMQLTNARRASIAPTPPPAAPEPVAAVTPPAPAAPAPTDDYYPPNTTAPTVALPAAVTPKTPIEDLYNPEKSSNDNQSAMDDIKKRYEDILVNYMFMKKCGKANEADYRIITSALGQEMASVNAPGRLQYDILTAAQGSYKEMYAQSSCAGESVNALYNSYSDYIKTLSANFPVQ